MDRWFKLRKITLFNFYNYMGKQEIDLTTNGPNNIFLFNISNGGGKTSLFHAIKWGFYGNAFDYYKSGKKMSLSDFMNTSADQSEGFYVELSFEYDDSQYILKRQYKPPMSKPILSLMKDGYTFDETNGSMILESIVPRNYGSFFMFDGEDLEQLSSAQNDAKLVEGVLQLIGLKEMKDLRLKIIKVADDYKRDRDNALTQESKDSTSIAERDKCEAQLKRIQDSIHEFKKKYDDTEKNIEKLRLEREKYSNTEPIVSEHNEITRKMGVVEGKMQGYKENIIKNRERFFIEFIKKDMNEMIKEKTEESKGLEVISGLPHDSATIIELQREIISNRVGPCLVCHKRMSEEDIRELKAEIESSESRYNRYAENKKRMDVLHKEIRFLSDILNWSSSNLAETIEKYYDGEYAVVDHKKQLDEHDKLLKDSGHDVISEITKQIEEEVKNGASHEGTINKLKDEERFWNKKYDDCIKKLKGSENISSLSRKYDSCYTKTLNIVDGLERVIEKGIRTKRDSILRNANTVFKKLTNKSNIYEGLEYESDKTYAFAILKKSGGRAKNPSAGETQVIAMSFLIALTMCTERNSPILMDTPLAKLDEVHASNVGDMLASLDNQILFLAQPMELSPHVMEGLKRSIAKQFALKLTDDNNAEILEVRT